MILAIHFTQVLLYVLAIWALLYLLYQFYQWLMRKNVAVTLEEEDFSAGMKRAQLIDLREAEAFRSAHIKGARNLPYSMFQQQLPGLNKQQPIYLYDDGMVVATRAARKLKKAGYTNLFILKGGFQMWTGKTKRRDV